MIMADPSDIGRGKRPVGYSTGVPAPSLKQNISSPSSLIFGVRGIILEISALDNPYPSVLWYILSSWTGLHH